MGIWRVTGSTWLQNLAVRSNTVFNSTPGGNKLVCAHNRMGMQFARKFYGMLMVKSQLFKLVKGMLNIAGPTDTQEDGVESHDLRTNEFAEVCMLPLCRLQLLSRPRVFTVLGFNSSAHATGLCLIGGCLTRLTVVVLCGAVSAVQRMVSTGGRGRRRSGFGLIGFRPHSYVPVYDLTANKHYHD
eukprot:1143237-Pelagomonas_calceolata.AAC.1